MKYISFAIIIVSLIIFIKTEDYDMSYKDVKECEIDIDPMIDNKGINACYNWTANHTSSIYKDYKCCYVEYKMGSDKTGGCYLIQDSISKIKEYKRKVLKQFSDVDVICSNSYIKYTSIFLIIFLVI